MPSSDSVPDAVEQHVLRAVAWGLGLDGVAADGDVAALEACALHCTRRVENVGARSPRVFSACLSTLTQRASSDDRAVAALFSLAAASSYSQISRQLQRAIAEVATERGVDEASLRCAAAAAAAAAAQRPVTRPQLDAVRAALDAGDDAGALALLVDCWRGARHAVLARAIGALGERVADASTPQALARGNKAARHEAFLSLVAEPPSGAAQAAAVTPLARMLDASNGRALRQQLEALSSWPADPRFAAALAPLVQSPTLRDARAWTALAGHLERHGDDGTLAALRPHLSVAMAHLSRIRAPLALDETLAAALSSLEQVVAATPPLFDELRTAVDALVAESGDPSGAPGWSAGDVSPKALLAAIYDAPDDDARRRVYADVLADSGDPRAELIAIQLEGEPSAATRKRERVLLKEHGRAWLGELADVIQSKGLVYRRGLPAEGRVAGKKLAAARALLDARAWRSFEALDFAEAWTLPDDLVLRESFSQLRAVSGLSWNQALVLLGADDPRPRLRSLSCDMRYPALDDDDDDDDDERVASAEARRLFTEAPALPGLRELTLRGPYGHGFRPETLALLSGSALAARLERFSMRIANRAVADAVTQVLGDPSLPVTELVETFRSWALTVDAHAAAGPTLALHSAGGSVDDEDARRLAELLPALAPHSFAAVTLTLPKRHEVSPQTLAAIDEAMGALQR